MWEEDQTEEVLWQDMILYGMYHRQIAEVADVGKSYQWLKNAGLKDCTEALTVAAQEQTLSNSCMEGSKV